ncbi:MAG: PTS galactosamine/N-acetylgalactosamine transporter subunit IIA [Erysipelotrichaceae bacterium]
MIGIIVCGHGNFGTGLTSSLNLIAGVQQDYVAVDFVQQDSVEDLEKKLVTAFNSLSDCDGILVMSDLAGGSPFKTAVTVAQSYKNIQVLAGTNLGMIIEISMARTMVNDLSSLVDMAINVGKDQVMKYEFKPVTYEESDDGI